MPLSVQQIKFELLSYIKEFGGDATQWQIGNAEDASQALFEVLQVDRDQDIWLWKPALSASAADLVVSWMVERRMASFAKTTSSGSTVFLYRRICEAR